MTNKQIKNIRDNKARLQLLAKGIENVAKDLAKVGYTNYKVHEASYWGATNGLDDELFDEWCEREYEVFEDYMKMECNEVLEEYVGRTSTFCFTTPLLERFDYSHIIMDKTHVVNVFSKHILHVALFPYSVDELLNTGEFLAICKSRWADFDFDEFLDEYESELENAADDLQELLDELKESSTQVRKAFWELKYFKKTQVESYKHFVEFMQA